MRARWMLLLAVSSGLPGVVVAGAGCSHTRRADDAPVTAAKEEPPEDAAKNRPAEARKKRAPAATSRKAETEPESDKDGPPLATGPEGLMTEGSVEKIQDRLRERDLLKGDTSSGRWDEPTRAALREFQRDNGVPATGMPDDVTLGKLGLKPGDIFRATKK